ncbi:MAG: hypothetical protein ACJ77O_00855 [Chloroflexota bacterium]
MLGDIVNALADTLHEILRWFQTLAPGGLGLILLPLIGLGVITILVSRKQ